MCSLSLTVLHLCLDLDNIMWYLSLGFSDSFSLGIIQGVLFGAEAQPALLPNSKSLYWEDAVAWAALFSRLLPTCPTAHPDRCFCYGHTQQLGICSDEGKTEVMLNNPPKMFPLTTDSYPEKGGMHLKSLYHMTSSWLSRDNIIHSPHLHLVGQFCSSFFVQES